MNSCIQPLSSLPGLLMPDMVGDTELHRAPLRTTRGPEGPMGAAIALFKFRQHMLIATYLSNTHIFYSKIFNK